MIYKFKMKYYYPVTTEVFISAESDEQALKANNELNLSTLDWKEDPIRQDQMTYEVVKDGTKS
jgi:hypothetical protein